MHNTSTLEVPGARLHYEVRGAWVKFLETANIHLPDEVLEMMIGGERDPQTVADERFQYEHMLRATTRWLPDIDALRSTGSRVAVGIGEDSAGQLCDRASRVLAKALGIEPTMFPGGHIAFAENPAAFAVRLREVLNK